MLMGEFCYLYEQKQANSSSSVSSLHTKLSSLTLGNSQSSHLSHCKKVYFPK